MYSQRVFRGVIELMVWLYLTRSVSNPIQHRQFIFVSHETLSFVARVSGASILPCHIPRVHTGHYGVPRGHVISRCETPVSSDKPSIFILTGVWMVQIWEMFHLLYSLLINSIYRYRICYVKSFSHQYWGQDNWLPLCRRHIEIF